MIIKYLKSRFSLLRYLSLSILLSLFVVSVDIPFALASWLGIVFFVFISLLLFRALDDAGSVVFDRADAERSYLSEQNYTYFLVFNAFLAILYFGFLLFIKFSYGWHLAAFYVLCIVCYFLFKNNKSILYVIPFLKYPLLLFVLGCENYQILLASLLLFLTYDLFEDEKRFNNGFAGILLCGMLVFFNPDEWTSLIYVFAPALIALMLRNHKFLKYLPILYFPIVYFIVNFLI